MENKIIGAKSDILLDIFVYAFLITLSVIFVYPVIFILANSISSADAVLRREVWVWPVGFSTKSYEMILDHTFVLPSYLNTIMYAFIGTFYSLSLTILGAYPLSRSYLPFRNFFMFIIAFTMWFSGGLIPTYLVVRDLGLINRLWAMILPCAVAPFNLILLKTNMQDIPKAIEESAKIDGANDFRVFTSIILPMSTAAIATVALLIFVAKWNDWFQALIYLTDRSKFPLQLILRDILITNSDKTLNQALLRDSKNAITPLGFKSAVMVISIAPLVIIYPFAQRFFVKGIMVGAVKG